MSPASFQPLSTGVSTGTKVAMYAQWRSIEDLQAMRRDPVASPYLDQALALAKFRAGDV